MGGQTMFSSRHIVLKLFVIQFLVFQKTYAAPSPIIKFPGDDTTPKTDKEVALVSLFVYLPVCFSVWNILELCLLLKLNKYFCKV